MKIKAHSLSFAALLLSAMAFAATDEVTFNTALTNNTEWTYETLKEGTNGYYVNKSGATITSPVYDFCITSITIHVSATDSCTRNLIITPVCENSIVTQLAREFTDIPKGSESDVTACWSIADNVNALRIESTSGAQNLYLLNAAICGVSHVDAPANLSVRDICGTRFAVTWENLAPSAAANAVYASKIIEHSSSGDIEAEYTFSQFANPSGNPKEITDEFTNALPSFAGSSLIYMAANSSAMIQISKDDTKGYLVHSGFEGCSNLSILISAKIPTTSQASTFGIGYETSVGTTNEFSTFNLTVDFETNVVSMADVPDGTPIIFNTQGTNKKRVVHVDSLSFVRDYMPAYVETNETARLTTTSSSATIRGLEPNSHYVVYVTAFDGEGNESAPSEPIEVWTNDKNLPFTINIR